MGLAVLIDTYRRFRDSRCTIVTESVPSHFLTNSFLVFVGIFYFTKVLRFVLTVSFRTPPPESCPIPSAASVPPQTVKLLTKAAYVNAILSALSQVFLILVLNMILNNKTSTTGKKSAESVDNAGLLVSPT